MKRFKKQRGGVVFCDISFGAKTSYGKKIEHYIYSPSFGWLTWIAIILK